MAPSAPRRALFLVAAFAASLPVFAQTNDPSRRSAAAQDSQAAARRRMVNEQIADRDVRDPRVLEAMRKVPRHRFVPPALIPRAYDDSPLPIGYDQTISQPFIVAHMTEALGIQGSHKVLEIGTGSGYQAAVLGELARTVYTIEIVPELARGAAATLKALGYSNVRVRAGDGYAGWPEQAPFDRIMLTAAPEEIPKPLIDQLAPRGRLLAPVGEQGSVQWLTIVEKTPQGVTQRRTLPVRFVPFTRSR
ncbi:MAG TPA: protein-L-isoaspartate(D-aspartate) O-methyltransferase [Vicinamibacterales bacterium]|nr:protein-L-isoaspartate(D-aspartate) O-methyltransferase [Vicinamibacterales bacterium]